MENNNWNISQTGGTQTQSNVKTFMANVFSWMFAGLAITTIAAYYFASDMSLMSTLVGERGLTILGYVVMFAPFIFVLLMGAGLNRFSYSVILTLFIAFATIMGISLSFVLLAYTASSIYTTFASASVMFGVMAVMGYTTSTDLTKLGNILMMALIGMIVASLINFFMQSSTMSYIISFIGVIVFTGLTAYDVQKLKRIGEGVEYGSESTKKLVIMGALSLYLDFINLFLSLLRLFGDRK
ncbi:MAG TPA: Bax inhibitor-1/YccA family protein [Bacteroidia bacterium]|jgi:FtsH-binding integral membrane protein|nr:Bax inhibitor-1/YccA family protein [Bacteroidia bacterium]HRH07397.1 Bax inhibitor-1/YccA family protein [Bacteroidia bacterium]HRH64229.1 Bax inhibitor-1/YccA family protein [Bacteroidia bacterium]